LDVQFRAHPSYTNTFSSHRNLYHFINIYKRTLY